MKQMKLKKKKKISLINVQRMSSKKEERTKKHFKIEVKQACTHPNAGIRMSSLSDH